MVVQQGIVGRLRQEPLDQAVAMRTLRGPSSDGDQVQYLRDQLAHSDAQLEYVRSERYTHFVQKEEFAHMRLLSSETKEWKSRVVSEAEQVLVLECAETARRTTKIQKTGINSFNSNEKEAEAQLLDRRESNSAQAQQLAASLQRNELGRQTVAYCE